MVNYNYFITYTEVMTNLDKKCNNIIRTDHVQL